MSENSLGQAPRIQDDLYRHINGAWLDSYEIPADRAVDGAFRDLVEDSLAHCRRLCEDAAAGSLERPQDGETSAERWDFDASRIGQLFQAYLDQDALEAQGTTPIAPLIQKVNSCQNRDELAKVLGELEREGIDSPVAFLVSIDAENPERYIGQFYQAGLGLPDESYYRQDEHREIREKYREFLAQMALESGIAPAGSETEFAQQVFDFETALARHHWDAVRSRDAQATNNPTTFEQFIGDNKGFNYSAWAEGLGVKLEAGVDPINVYMPSYQEGFAQLWADSDLDTLKRYLQMKVVLAFAPYLDPQLQELRFSFYGTTLSGTPQRPELWKRAVGTVESVLDEALGRAYVAYHFPPEHRAAMEKLVDALLAAYKDAISNLDWMGEETRERALEKLSKFTHKIGYPRRWRDDSGLRFSPDATLVDMIRASSAFETDFQLARILKPVDREEWHMSPQTVNAYYSPLTNEIVFPAAILQPPFFDPEASHAANFGGIGAVIGHEIGHGFDDQGSHYDGDGKLTEWWTEADREEFTKRTASLIAQYDVYRPSELPGEDVHVNGALTIGENIGDLGGLAIAYKAWSKTHPEEAELAKEFFFSWARVWRTAIRPEAARQRLVIDPHSPAEFRCNGVVRNLDAFHDTFQTTTSDQLWMEPGERVKIWE
ncbi:M13 family metallopeptidase [Varibaculum prostatecancerukia]|uniref:M13 family metallopeptidase n=1 Tax=Varibaculum prostatecancerukia TaxID=2811781 RepID=UPI001C000627|nr:M13-type metalloendopeptidase [Varibaculum prostatecancerukia]